MNAEIIAVGSEILSGKQCNTNAQYISEQLRECGIEVSMQTAVGDSESSIKAAVAGALGRCNIVVLTGGLGPTRDDITKQSVCDLLNIKLTVDEASLSKIESYFSHKGEKMAENNLRQAMVPEGCVIVKNDLGLSPGCILKSGNQCIVMLPGPPHEMCPMFKNSVKPFLKNMAGLQSVTKTVNVFGMTESLIASALDDMISKPSPYIATYAEGGKIDICVSAKGDDVNTLQREVDQAVEEIKRRLGDSVYGVDAPSVQHAVVSQLVARKITIATAESCTGGLLSKKITDISGSSLCFGFGVTSYSEDMKNAVLGVSESTLEEFGAVSAETACQMAVGAMNCANSDMGVSITGYAGPAVSLGEPVGLVFISVCNRETVWVKRFELASSGNETRDQIRELATLHAFDMIRRVLNGAAIFNCQRIPISEISNSDEGRDALRGKLLFRAAEPKETEPQQLEYVPMEGVSGIKAKLGKFAYDLLPNKHDATGEKVRKSVFLTASVALIVSVCYILNFFLGIQQNKNMYNDLEKLKTEKPDATISYPEGYLEQFGLLYQENEDIAGWVEIEGTQLNYPVVQGDDNSYYLTHNFYKKKERHGVPFMDYRNGIDELDFNTVLHGHNMKSDNQMFSELANYYKGGQALTYYRKHPLISFDTVYQQSEWKVFAVFSCSVNTSSDKFFGYYDMLNMASNEEFEAFIEEVRSRSIFNIPVDVQPTDNILTLSTCYYEYDDQRLVVMARKVRSGESSVVDVNSATHNRNASNNEVSSDENVSLYIPSSDNASQGVNSYNSTPGQTPNSSNLINPSSNPSSHISSNVSSNSSEVATSSDATTSNESTDNPNSSDVTTSDETSTSSEDTTPPEENTSTLAPEVSDTPSETSSSVQPETPPAEDNQSGLAVNE